MNTLTQYGRMAEKHWREHCPKMVRELEAKGQLHAMLLEAEEKTKDEMIELTQQFRKQGLTRAAGARPGLGNGAGGIHPAASRRPSRRPPGRQLDPRISTAIASPTMTGWAKAVPKQKFHKISGPSKSCGRLMPKTVRLHPDEKAALVKYVGWGAMPQVFDVDSTNWRKEQIQLSEILSDEEHRSARATTLNAHYTAPVVIRAMYEAAQRFGFQGRTTFWNRPAASAISSASCRRRCSNNSTITGIEIDPLTARIAKALVSRRRHPRAAV